MGCIATSAPRWNYAIERRFSHKSVEGFLCGIALAAVLSSVLIQLFASFPYTLACLGDPAAQEFEFIVSHRPGRRDQVRHPSLVDVGCCCAGNQKAFLFLTTIPDLKHGSLPGRFPQSFAPFYRRRVFKQLSGLDRLP